MATKRKSSNSDPAEDKAKTIGTDKPAEEKWLIVPPNPIDGGNDIAVGIRIKSAMLPGSAGGGATPTEAKIDLVWNDHSTSAKGASIATIALPKPALDMIGTGEPIQVSTRIKIAAKPKESVKGSLKAILTVAGHTTEQTVDLQITGNDNAAMNNGQMVLQIQAVKGTDLILVRSLAPSPQLKESKLREISGALSSPPDTSATTFISMTVNDRRLLSDDVFLAFNCPPMPPRMLEVSWSYGSGKDGGTQRLSAMAFLPKTKP
jgi:hypothetical protein